MIGGLVSPDDIRHVAENGSPIGLSAVGRILGLGQAEQAALGSGQIPWWLWTTIGIAGGVFVGVQLHKRWPSMLPKAMR